MNRLNKQNYFTVRKNTSVTLGLMAIAMLMILPLTLSESYAITSGEYEWQLIFIQEAECNQNDNLNEVYSSLTTKYFELYQLENTSHDALCMTELEYSNYQMNEDIDLLILIYDGKVGEKILGPNKVDGLYIHTGNDRTQNHLIIMCHCSDFDSSYEKILPSWILSHELSHFVLSYKGFPQAVIQNAIHENEDGYDNCIGTNFQDEFCKDFKTTIRPDYVSKDFPVMKPYESAVGQKLVTYIPDDFSDSQIIDFQRNLAKMWTTNEIDDNAFLNTLKNLVDSPTVLDDETHESFMKIENGFVIAESSKPTDITWDQYLNLDSLEEDNTQLLLDHIPFNLDEKIDELDTKEMPNWFKTRALLWSEQRISDKVFFNGVEHLVRMGTVNID
jgi:hypothetical protein